MIDLAVIGGGAAGFFTAINLKQKNPALKIVIFEKGRTVLNKVRISGGGRCNVTHAYFDIQRLVGYYPRGSRELLSVFKQFSPTETIKWFESRGIPLKKESDGRVFPVSDNSESIIECFLKACTDHSIDIKTSHSVTSIQKKECFHLEINGELVLAKKVLVATGSSLFFWNILEEMGHTIVDPVPSLFTFNIQNPLIEDLQGLSVPNASVKLMLSSEEMKTYRLKSSDISQNGPMLITHWGLSGPAILKLSSIAARVLNAIQYRFIIQVSLSNLNTEATLQQLMKFKEEYRKKMVSNSPLYGIPTRWWQRIVELTFEKQSNWSDLSKKDLQKLAENLSAYTLEVDGKSTFKDEFVTAGGIDLKEIDFKSMESKVIPGMYLAGEVLNIDALTGGFNFQAAWSEAWVISEEYHN